MEEFAKLVVPFVIFDDFPSSCCLETSADVTEGGHSAQVKERLARHQLYHTGGIHPDRAALPPIPGHPCCLFIVQAVVAGVARLT